MIKELQKYLESATPEQLEKDWEELKQWENVGPDALQYCEWALKHCES